MTAELKPCPFCGNKAYCSTDNSTGRIKHGAACSRCDAEKYPNYGTRQEAVNKWNHRPATENTIKLNRLWAMPSRQTFTIKPIKDLLNRYDAKYWIDPFAGFNSPCEKTNDLNPNTPTMYHEKALDFIKRFDMIEGVIFDPPYTLRQVKECYEGYGHEFLQEDTQNSIRWTKERDAIAERLNNKGTVISFGYSSTCMGKKRGFEIVEILLVSHGAAHYDTIATVERYKK